ncbi:hypothetical protein WA577_004849 [Blastocystis sp. JDR]
MKRGICSVLLVLLLLSFTAADCLTFASQCLYQTSQIQRLGVFRDKNGIPTQFVYTITRYNDQECTGEQYAIKYEESLSCAHSEINGCDDDTTCQVVSAFTCSKTVDAISIHLYNLTEMALYGYNCPSSMLNKDVAISKNACMTGSTKGFAEVSHLLGSTGQYAVYELVDGSVRIGHVVFSREENELCEKSYLGLSLVIGGSFIAVVLAALIVFCLTKRYERRRLRRLSRTTRIDVGDSDDEDEEEGKSTSPTPDVIE